MTARIFQTGGNSYAGSVRGECGVVAAFRPSLNVRRVVYNAPPESFEPVEMCRISNLLLNRFGNDSGSLFHFWGIAHGYPTTCEPVDGDV